MRRLSAMVEQFLGEDVCLPALGGPDREHAPGAVPRRGVEVGVEQPSSTMVEADLRHERRVVDRDEAHRGLPADVARRSALLGCP
jgi:hypothetical protein